MKSRGSLRDMERLPWLIYYGFSYGIISFRMRADSRTGNGAEEDEKKFNVKFIVNGRIFCIIKMWQEESIWHLLRGLQ